MQKPLAKSQKMVRLSDIALKAGVSRVTVSKVLFPNNSNNTRVAEETAQRIHQIARQMGYTPNLSAKQLAGERSKLFGAIIDSFAPKVSYSVLAFLERAMALHGYRLIVGQLHNEVQPIEGYLRDFAGRGVEGIVCLANDYSGQLKDKDDLYRTVKNIVFISVPMIPWADWVGADIASGISDLLTHLAETGRSRIALYLTDGESAACRIRMQAFRQGIDQLGFSAQACPIWIMPKSPFGAEGPGDASLAISQDLAQRFDQQRVDAIIAMNDLVAMYVVQFLASRQIVVPDHIAVAGFDNTEMAPAMSPPLTSVDQCPAAVAAKAVELLLWRANNPGKTPQSVWVTPHLVVRKST